MKRILFSILLTGVCGWLHGSCPTTTEDWVKEVIKQQKANQHRLITHDYNAVPCADRALIKRFKQIQKNLHIKDNVKLFESQKFPKELPSYAKAFYNYDCEVVVILQPYFSQQSVVRQDAILFHELRHHIQNTTGDADDALEEYMENMNLSWQQAIEYDADIISLQAAKNCPLCICELRSFRDINWVELHDSDGYMTSKAIQSFLESAQKNPCVCDRHKTMRNYSNFVNIVFDKMSSKKWTLLALSAICSYTFVKSF